MLTLAALEDVLAKRGLTPRGAFHPTAIDEVPALADGSAAATLVLAGNAGPAMWDAFARARGDDPRLAGDHALDEFSRIVLGEIAGEFGFLVVVSLQKKSEIERRYFIVFVKLVAFMFGKSIGMTLFYLVVFGELTI